MRAADDAVDFFCGLTLDSHCFLYKGECSDYWSVDIARVNSSLAGVDNSTAGGMGQCVAYPVFWELIG